MRQPLLYLVAALFACGGDKTTTPSDETDADTDADSDADADADTDADSDADTDTLGPVDGNWVGDCLPAGAGTYEVTAWSFSLRLQEEKGVVMGVGHAALDTYATGGVGGSGAYTTTTTYPTTLQADLLLNGTWDGTTLATDFGVDTPYGVYPLGTLSGAVVGTEWDPSLEYDYTSTYDCTLTKQ
jgi:hypothetical protein